MVEGGPVKRRRAAGELDAIELLEEAAHLLRRLPVSSHAAYLVGTVPFVLALLFFVGDMSRSAQAADHLAEAALGMVAVFAWMKTWQSFAAEQTLAYLEHRRPAKTTLPGFVRVGAQQFRIHAFSLCVLPLAGIVALPAGWAYAYYQHVTVLGFSAGSSLHSESVHQCKLWPGQNHLVLGLVSVFAVAVFLNMAVSIYVFPGLLRMLLGTEDMFSTEGWNPMNTTFLAVSCGLAYLCVDPLVKAVYALRTFYGKSQRTGVDLLLQARGAVTRFVSIAMVVSGVFLGALNGWPADEDSVPPADVVSVGDLDSALDGVLSSPEYSWRMPRAEKVDEKENTGLVGRFFESVLGIILGFFSWLGDVIEKVVEWLFGQDLRNAPESAGGGSFGFAAFARFLMIGLGCVLVLVLLWFAWRWFQSSRNIVNAKPQPMVVPELEGENVMADELPEDEWLRAAALLR
jgi:hypothetical protein